MAAMIFGVPPQFAQCSMSDATGATARHALGASGRYEIVSIATSRWHVVSRPGLDLERNLN
jgi:hypothetical protein